MYRTWCIFCKLVLEPLKPVSGRRRSKLEKYRQEKAARSKDGILKGLNVAEDDYFILIEVDELKYQLEVWMLCLILSTLSEGWK